MAESDRRDWNRDDQQKPGRPPRSAYEPKGSQGSAKNGKTMTDPSTGAPAKDAPDPPRSDADDTPD